jgi:hypothetical protein
MSEISRNISHSLQLHNPSLLVAGLEMPGTVTEGNWRSTASIRKELDKENRGFRLTD